MDARIAETMLSDRHRLRQQLARLRKAGAAEDARERFEQQLEESLQRRLDRAARVPAVSFAGDLPIHERLDEIRDAIDQHPVVVICGETGSGKSTQLPKLCLTMGRGVAGMIGHTQPRRIAARSVAARVAEELGTSLGTAVGYKVRFSDVTQEGTYIKLMTDGILLAETQNDRYLDQYDTIIVDEAHERSMNIDFLLGYLHRLLARRSDLRVIVTSATIDVQRFSQYFATARGPAPVIEVSGRSYPVEVRYRPPQNEEDPTDPDRWSALSAAVAELMHEGPGDMLVFLPTERDIRDAAKLLRGALKASGPVELLPLYGRLSTAEQQRVFQPHPHRRLVLATNVAESSLTVPNIHFVIDMGLARISRYSARSKVQRLPIEPISQASANQRSGRCGRLGPGICIRLYSEEDFAARDPYPIPEVRRINLASVILQTMAMKLGNIESFPLLDPPAPEKIRDGYRTLFEIGAIDEHRELTDIGRKLARLPVDPRIGRMILAADAENCLAEVVVIAAAIESQDPRLRPVDQQEAADAAHQQFADEKSDFLSYLKLWDFYHHLRETLSRSQLQKACRQNFLSLTRLREWSDIYRQLLPLVDQLGYKRRPRQDDYAAIHRALLTGLLSGVAMRTEAREYTGPGGVKFQLWPGSSIFGSKPSWVVAAELVETSRRYLRTVAAIQPEWIEPLAEHLVKRSYSDPHWSSRRGEAMVYERVTLLGMPIVTRRPTRLAALDLQHAHELFVHHALVLGEGNLRGDFLEHNRRTRQDVEQLSQKTRRRELLLDEAVLAAFYHSRVPQDVVNAATFQQWLRDKQHHESRVLHMTSADLIDAAGLRNFEAEDFPDEILIGTSRFPLTYRFEPGNAADGVTLTAPLEAVPLLEEDQLEWLVPGMLEEKVLALIRALPKQARRNFVPAPDAARRLTQRLKSLTPRGPFLRTLAKVMSEDAGEPISPSMFSLDRLPAHLRINTRIVDAQQKILAEGRDLNELRRTLGISKLETSAASVDKDNPWKRAGLRTWQWDDLPETVNIQRGGVTLPAYPAIVDQQDSVALDLYMSPLAAREAMHKGLRRLAWLEHHRAIMEQVQWLPQVDKLQLFGAKYASSGKSVRDDFGLLMCELAYCQAGPQPRSAEQYRRWLKQGKSRIPAAAQDVSKVAYPLMETLHRVRMAVDKMPSAWKQAKEDLERQLEWLVPRGFLVSKPWPWLQHYPRYLQAILVRLDKLAGNLARDRQHQAQLEELLARWQQAVESDPSSAVVDEALQQYRWMIEELRVSLLAQQLGVSLPVSVKKLDKQWELYAAKADKPHI